MSALRRLIGSGGGGLFTALKICSSFTSRLYQTGIRDGVSHKRGLQRRILSQKPNLPSKSMESMGLLTKVQVNTNSQKIAMAVRSATEFDLYKLQRELKATAKSCSFVHQDVLYCCLSDGEVFVFRDGCFVMWGDREMVKQSAMFFASNVLRGVESKSSTGIVEQESLVYVEEESNGNQFQSLVQGEVIHLQIPTFQNEAIQQEMVKAKAALSNGLVDSVQLAVLESQLNEHIARFKSIPSILARRKKLSLNRADVLQMTGELLMFRAELNLHSELIETPEMYWAEPQLEQLYGAVTRCLDIRQRANVLNKKLDCAKELAEVVRMHLSEQHGLKLEWSIIILIAVEVLFATIHLLTD